MSNDMMTPGRIGRQIVACAVATPLMLAWVGVYSAASSRKPPRKVKDVAPVYPPESLTRGDEGWVILELDINADGTVQGTRILRSSCGRFNEAAVTAVRQWQWDRVLVNGKPTPFTMTVKVPFRRPGPFKSRVGRRGGCRWTAVPEPIR